jgi:hypothetical protein
MALVACLLWLAGFEVLPWMHVALHDELAPHIHAADGTIIRVSFSGEVTHRHADGTIHRGPEDHDDRAPAKRHHPTRPGYGLDHGAGSLAHHGVAILPAAAPLHAPLPIDRRPVIVALADAPVPVVTPVPTASARGPPAAPRARV